MIVVYGTGGDNSPVDHRVDWMCPTNGSTLGINIYHVRIVDGIRLRFDFESHQWVAEQELQAATDHEPATGKWVEVARWSGNAPSVNDAPMHIEIPTPQQEATIREAIRLMEEQTTKSGSSEYCDSQCCYAAQGLLEDLLGGGKVIQINQTLTMKVHTENDQEVDMIVMGLGARMVPVMVTNPNESDASKLRVKYAPPGTPTDKIIGYVACEDIDIEETT